MRARVSNGRWILEDPTDLPEGTIVEIVTRVLAPANAPSTIYLDAKLREYIRALLIAASSSKYSAGSAGHNPADEDELAASAKSNASRANRSYVTPADIKVAAVESLRRLVVPGHEQRVNGVTSEQIVRSLLDEVPVP